MPGLLDSLLGSATSPVSTLISTAMSIIDRVAPSAEEKAKAQVELLTAQTAATLQLAQIDAENNQTASANIVAEAKSESWLTRNWRPIMAMQFGAIIAYNFMLGPMFGLRSVDFPPQLWPLLTMMIGGYTWSRSGEKMWADYQATKRATGAPPAAPPSPPAGAG